MTCEHASMRAARRQGVLEVVRCGTRSSSSVRARAPPVQHLLHGGYKRGLLTFQFGQMHHGHFGTPEEENGGGGGGGKQLSESQSCRRRFGVCFTLTIPGSCARRLASPCRRPRLRTCVYARRVCRSPPPYSA